MEENENKKNNKFFYVTMAVVLAVIAILIIATSVARRNAVDTPTPPDDSSSTPDTQNPPSSETTVLPEFSLPVDGEISFDFSDSVPVFSPTMEDWRTHLGVDVLGELGAEVLAVADGTVTNVWEDPFMGTCISIEHSGNAISVYKNLAKEVADGIVVGCSVKAGDVIGNIGETAMNEIAQEPHLHYELSVDGKIVDPKDHIKFPTKDIPEDSTDGEQGNSNNQQSTEKN
ncbi:MAG: peptidoglycan DD-metalloendopeptidase family protein [Clostridia bacterium]|nr:peptidoglycan DD-metalloendopeptidase family protein [Clostridia bacterium]